MTWLDLESGILEEFVDAHNRFNPLDHDIARSLLRTDCAVSRSAQSGLYRTTPQGQASLARYRASPKYKQTLKRCREAWLKTPEGIAYKKKHNRDTHAKVKADPTRFAKHKDYQRQWAKSNYAKKKADPVWYAKRLEYQRNWQRRRAAMVAAGNASSKCIE